LEIKDSPRWERSQQEPPYANQDTHGSAKIHSGRKTGNGQRPQVRTKNKAADRTLLRKRPKHRPHQTHDMNKGKNNKYYTNKHRQASIKRCEWKRRSEMRFQDWHPPKSSPNLFVYSKQLIGPSTTAPERLPNNQVKGKPMGLLIGTTPGTLNRQQGFRDSEPLIHFPIPPKRHRKAKRTSERTGPSTAT
jgi:hypothetical protein